MIEIQPPDMYGSTIFCDDIRVEVDGKFTFVGAYGGRLYINASFPVTLPKFAVSITFNQLKEKFQPNLGLRVFLPGDVDEASIQGDFGEVAKGAILREIEKEPPIPEGTKYIGMTANMVMAPLILKEEGIITVRVVRGDEFYRVGRCAVMKGPIVAPLSEPLPRA